MRNFHGVIIVSFYLFAMLTANLVLAVKLYNYVFFDPEVKQLLICAVIGGFGGLVYCLRGVYLNFCVKNVWSNQWIPWYLIRPIVSCVTGAIGYIFLQAGLLLLESQKDQRASNLGYYAVAFVAGMNVDKFIEKIEDLAQASWGIDKTRTGNEKK